MRPLLGSAALIMAAATVTAQPQDAIDALLIQGQQAGARYLQTRDGGSQSAARKALGEAEKRAREAGKRDAACEPCFEQWSRAVYFQAIFGLAKNYDESVEVSSEALARFPGNGRIAMYKGVSHYRRGQFGEAARALKRYMASTSRDAETDAIVQQMIADSQTRFLTAWYNQANFYQSNESRVTRLNTQTFQNEVVLQFTPELERQLGQQGFVELSKTARPASDPEALAFLQQLVARIVEKTPGPGIQYQLTLVDSPEVNAVTTPGYIFVYTGLLRFVDTEAQLAAILSHEIAHNYGHHAARRVIKAVLGQNIAQSLAGLVNPQTTRAQQITQLVSGIGLDLFLRAYNRFEEKEADLYGAHLMFNAGYHPTSMASFFLKLYQANPRTPPRFISTHPPAPDRADYLSDYLETFPLDRELVVDSSDAFRQMKSRYPSTAAGVPGIPRFRPVACH